MIKIIDLDLVKMIARADRRLLKNIRDIKPLEHSETKEKQNKKLII
jgi:hypothetical protein